MDLRKTQTIDMVTITEETGGNIEAYRLEYRKGKQWHTLYDDQVPDNTRVRIHRFAPVKADAVRITILRHHGKVCLSEVGVYAPNK